MPLGTTCSRAVHCPSLPLEFTYLYTRPGNRGGPMPGLAKGRNTSVGPSSPPHRSAVC